MNPAQHVRIVVFQCETQQAFARLLEIAQATVSRWEASGQINSTYYDLIRKAAKARRIRWMDRWFVEVPSRHRKESA